MEDDELTYKYYLLHGTTPIRVAYDARGLKRGAEAPDAITGKLIPRATLLTKLETEWEVEEIDEPGFREQCAAIYARALTPPKGRARTAEQKRALIERVLASWQELEHLRLGQLIDNACATREGASVFFIEDEALADAIDVLAERLRGKVR